MEKPMPISRRGLLSTESGSHPASEVELPVHVLPLDPEVLAQETTEAPEVFIQLTTDQKLREESPYCHQSRGIAPVSGGW